MMNKCLYVRLRAHIPESERKEERSMNRVWANALVPLLVAATRAILEVIKILKKKGKAAS
jgi:uncharacterized membrane protein